MLFPTSCPICKKPGQAPCRECLTAIKAPTLALPPAGVDIVWALFSYEGVAKRLITSMKYSNNRVVLPGLGRAMANIVCSSSIPVDFEIVTWIPTTSMRRRRRGYDQAELLAKAVAGELSLPSRRLLIHHPGPAQTGRNLASRKSGPLIDPLGRCPSRVLLIDDVVTSGSSASASAAALRNAGARFIAMLSAARTPELLAKNGAQG